MKNLIFWLLFFGLFARAEAGVNWFPVGKQNASTVFFDKAKCEQVEGQQCFDITNKDPRFHEIQTSMVDDPSKPILKPPYNSTNCDSESDCDLKGSTLGCQAGDTVGKEKNAVLPGWTIFCTGITGYQQKEQTVLVENAALKASVQAADAAKAQQDTALAQVQKNMDFGVKVIGLMSIRNASKNLSKGQTKQMVQDYSLINDLLRAGAIETAKDEIAAITPDGTITTQADKDAILAEINAFLGQ